MSAISNYFSTLPQEIQRIIFRHVVGIGTDEAEMQSEVQRLAVVCKAWQQELNTDLFWSPILSFYADNWTYEIDLSSEKTPKGQVKLFLETRKKDLGDLLKKCGCDKDVKDVLNRTIDLTPFLSGLIQDGMFEELAQCLLFKPLCDANRIIAELISSLGSAPSFCFDLLIKLHYDLTSFFKDFFSKEPFIKIAILLHVLGTAVKGLSLVDFLKSGCDFRAFETESVDLRSNFSFLTAPLRSIPLICYYTGKFAPAPFQMDHEKPPPFTDKKLTKWIKTDRLSEQELEQFFRDLLFKCNLNLNIRVPVSYDLDRPGTALSRFKAVANSLPSSNALKTALAEYEKAYPGTL